MPTSSIRNITLAPLVYMVPPEQHDHTRKQSQHLLFKFRWRYLLFASKLAGQLGLRPKTYSRTKYAAVPWPSTLSRVFVEAQ